MRINYYWDSMCRLFKRTGVFFLTCMPAHAAPVDINFGYDALNRLTAAAGGGYNYDAAGNLLQITGAAAPVIVVEQPAGTGLTDNVSSIPFGSVNVGNSSSAFTFTIKNSGTADLTGLSVYTDGSHSGDFAINTTGMLATVPVGSSTTTFTVTFTPSASGARTAALHIASNDALRSPFDIALTGNGGATPTYTLTTSSVPAGGGVTSGGGTFDSGTTQTVTATPNGGYSFVNWTEGGTPVSTSASYSLTLTGSRSLVANFTTVTYTIVTSSSPAVGGSTSGGGTYAAGTTQTVTATPNGGYSFVNWTEGGTPVSTSASYSFTLTGSRALVANFSAALDAAAGLDASGRTFSSAGTASWFGQTGVTHDGVDAVRSGVIGDNGVSSLVTTITGPATVSFYWKVSSEAGFDSLRVYVDDVDQGGGISGAVDWAQRTLSISAGSHTLRWSYSKDGSVSVGADAGYVDQLFIQTSGPGWRSAQLTAVPNAADGNRTGAAHPSASLYFYKGTDSNVWASYWNGTQWAQAQLSSDGNVDDWLSYGTSYGLLAYKGKDNKLWVAYWTGSAWAVAPLGSNPNVAGDLVMDDAWNLIYYRGTDSRMWVAYWSGTQWTQASLGGAVPVVGSLAVDGVNHLIYFQGGSGQMWCYYWSGAAWLQAQLSAAPNVGGSVAADTGGGLAYYRSSADNSAWCVYWNGSAWAYGQLDAAAGMGTSTSIAPLARNVALYLNGNGQCAAEYWGGASWGSTVLGDGGWGLTGGLSVQRSTNLVFTRRNDGNVVIFYYQ